MNFHDFGGQTTKNVQSVRKIALKKLIVCLDGGLPCLDELRVLFLGENNVGCIQLVKGCIFV